jgi:hypothetical protein
MAGWLNQKAAAGHRLSGGRKSGSARADPLEDALRNTIRAFVAHYHMERNHQGLENCLRVLLEMIDTATAVVKKSERLGGLLNYYYREAA